MVDIHSHVLPGIDDGARSWDIAVSMCRMAAEDGIDHMVATPHANDNYPYDREWFDSLLQELAQKVGPVPALSLGCDFHFSYENLRDLEQHPHRYTIGGTRYLLIELSDYAIPAATGKKIEELIASGLRPILTHPERNLTLRRKPEKLLSWVEAGCIVQVTASALTGSWGEGPRRCAAWLLERRAVHVLATDAHSLDGRPPVLSRARDAVARLCGSAIAAALVEQNPGAIVRDQPLPYFPPLNL